MAMYTAITYIGKTPGFAAKVGKRIYEFEWQKGVGIGRRSNEIKLDNAMKISKWRDRKGKKIFILE
jgi:hypothetical protein